jgi:hypothetical protein
MGRVEYDLIPCEGCKGNVRIKVPRLPRADGEAVMDNDKQQPRQAPTAAPRKQRAPSGPPPSRITSIHSLVFQRSGEQPVSVPRLKYERSTVGAAGDFTDFSMTVGPQWVPVDLHGLPRIALVVIRNDEGTFNVRPTPEELTAAMARIVEVGFGDAPEPGGPIVSPRQNLPMEVADPSRLRLRCRSESAQIRITLIPG